MPSLKKNFLYQSIYQILLILAPLVTAPYVSRILGPEGVGVNAFTSSIAQYFALVAMLGIADHGARTVARVRANRQRLDQTFSDLLALHLAASALALAAYVVFTALYSGANRDLLAVQGLWIVAALFDLNWLFTGVEEFGAIVARNTIAKIATVAAIFALVREPGDLGIYAAVLAFGGILGQLFVLPFVRRHVTWTRPSWSGVVRHVRPMVVLFVPAIAISVFRVANRIILGSMTTGPETGYFANAEKLVAIPLSLIWAFASVMLPRISSLVSSGHEEIAGRLHAVSFRYMWMVGAGLAFGLAGVAPVLAPLFLGQEFAATGRVIAVMSAVIPVTAFASVIRTQCLVPRSMDKQFIASLFCGAGVSVIANLLLIPAWGALGAAIALVAAELTVCVAQAVSARQIMPVGEHARSGVFFIGVGLVMYAIVAAAGGLLGGSIGTVVVQITIGALLYLSACGWYLRRARDAAFLGAIRVGAAAVSEARRRLRGKTGQSG